MEDGGSLHWKTTSKDLWSVHADSAKSQIMKKETESLISMRNEDH
jgi:hypothetical protein